MPNYQENLEIELKYQTGLIKAVKGIIQRVEKDRRLLPAEGNREARMLQRALFDIKQLLGHWKT